MAAWLLVALGALTLTIDPASAYVPSVTSTTVERRVASSDDDAEEDASGVVSRGSGDLELIHDATDQTVGLRWTALAIPPGVTITAAWIQFSADESQSEVTSLTLHGQAADNPPTFQGTLNISSRLRTSASAAWSPASWLSGETSNNQKTPDLSAIVQEIVNRPGWASGNALVMVVTGTGHRTAVAFDGNAALAPLLHVEYVAGPPPDNPPIARLSVSLLASPPLSVSADASASTDTDATPIASYQFDFGDATAPVTVLAPSTTAQHVYASAGTYTITLKATDSAALISAPVTEDVTVGSGNLAPNGVIDDPATNVTIAQGQSVLIRGTGIDPDHSGPLSYLWDFGGGATNQTVEDPGSVTFNLAGVYTLHFTVTDALGLADPTPDTRTITVNPPTSPPADEVHWTIIGQTAVTFDWRGGSTTLRYGTTPAYGQTATGVAPSPIPFSSAGPFREAKLTGLAENTLYHYSIGTDPDHTFRTPPPRGTSNFTIVAQGDIGPSTNWTRQTAIQSRIGSIAPNFALMLGDLTYGNEEGQWAVDDHFNGVMVWARDAAYQVVWGNHEWENAPDDDLRNYKGRFELPNPQTSPGAPSLGGTGEDWSWFDYGNVRFIAYPEPYTSSATWADWGTKAAAIMDQGQSDPNIRFIVTFGHRPPYSSGLHSGETQLQTIMGSLGAAHSKYVLNLNGHSHDYERSYPQSGVVHITAGTGGANMQTSGGACLWPGGCPKPAWSAYRAMHHVVLQLHFTATSIEGTALCGPPQAGSNDVSCVEGTVLDSWVITAAPTGVGAEPLGPARAWVAPVPIRDGGIFHYVNPEPGLVTASLYDASGRRVRRWLDHQWMPAGKHQAPFDGRDAQGAQLRSGVYLYKVELAGRVVTGRLSILR